MKLLGVFLLVPLPTPLFPLDGALVDRKVTPRIKFDGTHFYISPQKTQAPGEGSHPDPWTEVERTNRETAAPPQL